MLGYVWQQIALRSARRPAWLLLRCAFAAVQFLVLLNAVHLAPPQGPFPPEMDPNLPLQRFVEANLRFVQGWLWVQLVVAVCVSVPLVAGEITREKERGTLAHLLVTPLEPWRLLGGKLLGRGAQVLSLVWAGLPLYCYAAAGAGLSAVQIVAQAALLVLWVYGLCAAGLLASVWGRTTREAVLGMAVALAATVAVLFVAWVLLDDVARGGGEPWLTVAARGALVPLHLVVTGADPLALVHAETETDLVLRWLAAALVYGGCGSVCLALAVWRLRPVYLRALEKPTVRKGFWHQRPAPGDEPVCWREQFVTGLVTGPLVRRLPAWATLTLVALAAGAFGWQLFGVLGQDKHPLRVPVEPIFVWGTVGVVVLVACLRSAEAITGERQGDTWETLLLTPLTDAELVGQKFRGILRAMTAPLMAFLVPVWLAAAVAGTDVFWLAIMAVLPMHLWFMQRGLIAVGLTNSAATNHPSTSLGNTVIRGGLVIGVAHLMGVILGGMVFAVMALGVAVSERFLPAPSLISLVANLLLILVLWGAGACVFLECFSRHYLIQAARELARRDRIWQEPMRHGGW